MSAGTIQHLKYRTLSKHIDIVCIHMLRVNIFIASVEAAYITLQSFQLIPVDFGFCFCQFLIQEQTIVPLHQNKERQEGNAHSNSYHPCRRVEKQKYRYHTCNKQNKTQHANLKDAGFDFS